MKRIYMALIGLIFFPMIAHGTCVGSLCDNSAAEIAIYESNPNFPWSFSPPWVDFETRLPLATDAHLLNGLYDLLYNNKDYIDRRVQLEDVKEECPKIIVGDSRVAAGGFTGYCNFGIGGDMIWGIWERLTPIVNKSPDTVAIQVGFNDLYAGWTVYEVYLKYIEVLGILRSFNITPVVHSTIYAGPIEQQHNYRIFLLNTLLWMYCVSNNITFVDLNDTLAPGSLLLDGYSTPDDIHLTPAAYTVWNQHL